MLDMKHISTYWYLNIYAAIPNQNVYKQYVITITILDCLVFCVCFRHTHNPLKQIFAKVIITMTIFFPLYSNYRVLRKSNRHVPPFTPLPPKSPLRNLFISDELWVTSVHFWENQLSFLHKS
jgi:hypothetical protein